VNPALTVFRALSIIHPSVSLLHHLIYPIPIPKTPSPSLSQSQTQSRLNTSSGPDPEPEPLNGLNLTRRLHDASMQKEFNGLAHIFVSCLGAMAYATPNLGSGVEKESWRWGGGDFISLQCELSSYCSEIPLISGLFGGDRSFAGSVGRCGRGT